MVNRLLTQQETQQQDRQETMLSMDECTAMGAVPPPVHGAVLRAVLEFYERFWSSGVHK
jgi:hypothetical protein